MTRKCTSGLVCYPRWQLQLSESRGDDYRRDMTSPSSSSFSGPWSPVSPSAVAQTDRKQGLSGPRSGRAYAGYQPSSDPRRENGSKVRCSDVGREACLRDRTGRPAAPREHPREGAKGAMTGLFPIEMGRESRSSRGGRQSADDSGSPCSRTLHEAPGRASVTWPFSHDSDAAVFQAHQRHQHESSAAEYTNRRLHHAQLQVASESEPVQPVLPLLPLLPPPPTLLPPRRLPPPSQKYSQQHHHHHRRAAPSLAYSLDDRRVHVPSSGSLTPQRSPRPRSVR